jgi:hypothetical protein
MITPNPISTATNLNANISVPMIDSLFIKQGLGPNGTAGTMISDIDYGFRITSKVKSFLFSSLNKPMRLLKQQILYKLHSTVF